MNMYMCPPLEDVKQKRETLRKIKDLLDQLDKESKSCMPCYYIPCVPVCPPMYPPLVRNKFITKKICQYWVCRFCN